MIKTILVPAIGNSTDAVTFGTALQLARSFAAHIDVLHVRLDAVEVAVAMSADISGGGVVSSGMIDQLEQEVEERETRAHHAFAEFCAREGLAISASPSEAMTKPSAQWHVETGRAQSWLAAYALTADLIVASRGGGGDASSRSLLEAVLLETGRPLLIPSATPPSAAIFKKIAIGWKPTPEAARAVALAMPLLAKAEEITVMTVEEGEARQSDAGRLVRALTWHGFSVTAERLVPGLHGAAETLLDAAAAKAALLVMGGYGHGRLREWVFGGFTERVLADAPVPVLIAH
jgi:nucleotide-binding universal stress UspA family protein